MGLYQVHLTKTYTIVVSAPDAEAADRVAEEMALGQRGSAGHQNAFVKAMELKHDGVRLLVEAVDG